MFYGRNLPWADGFCWARVQVIFTANNRYESWKDVGGQQCVNKVTDTTDSWRTLNTESYVTIICHFIQNWDLTATVLLTHSTDEKYTAKHIVLLYFNINRKTQTDSNLQLLLLSSLNDTKWLETLINWGTASSLDDFNTHSHIGFCCLIIS